jgi:hypothetical protein
VAFTILALSKTQHAELSRVSMLLSAQRQSVEFLESGVPPTPGSSGPPPNRRTAALLKALPAINRWCIRNYARAKSWGIDSVATDLSTFSQQLEAVVQWHLHQLQQADDFLGRHQAQTLIVGEDGLGGDYHLITKAREAGWRVVVVPYEYSSRRQIETHIRSDAGLLESQAINSIWRRAAARLWPRWASRADPAVLRLPLVHVIAIKLLGLDIRQPWTVHGGGADLICVESPRMLDHYRREGVPEAKLAVTGMLALDDLHSALQPRQRGRRLRILCAFPPNYVPTRGAGEIDSYGALLRRWVEIVRSQDAEIIFQAHPAARAWLAEHPIEGVTLATEGITTLIGQCDVLVTSVSSVIRLALAAGKPTLNWDVYRFAYDDYRNAGGAVTVETASEFADAYRLLFDPDRFAALKQKAEADAPSWGKVDGKAGERILTTLLGKPPAPGPAAGRSRELESQHSG